MNQQPHIQRHGRNLDTWLGILLAMGMGILFYGFKPTGEFLRHLSHDLPYLLQQPVPGLDNPGVVVVHMDEWSQEVLYPEGAPEMWDRSHHTRLIQRLDDLGVSAIVFDILFQDPWPQPEVDQALAEAMANAKCPIILAAHLLETEINLDGQSATHRLIKATDSLASVSHWGTMEQPQSRDGIIRQHSFNETHPNLAWRCASLLNQAPADFHEDAWIRYYGTRNFVPNIPYARLFEEEGVAREQFEGKIVIVGDGRRFDPSNKQSASLHATPLTRWHGLDATATEIHATLLLNLLGKDWTRELPLALEWVLFLSGGFLAGSLLPRFRPGRMLMIGLGTIFIIGLGAWWLFHSHNLWFPWLVLGGIQIPTVMTWAFLRNSQRLFRQRDVLEQLVVEQSKNQPTSPSPFPLPVQARSRIPTEPVIPDHEMLLPIGKGAYGEVWLARNKVGLYHAVKIVRRNDFEKLEPYEREFNGIKRFMPISRNHHGLIHILHVGRNESEGYFYYIMEIGDDSLTRQKISPEQYQPRNLAKDLRKKKRMSLNEAVSMVMALCDAVDHLHQAGLIHRDIKPANIIFIDGHPKLADIGLVAEVNDPASTQTFIGTEGYIPPEGAGSPAADVFSLGKVLYESVMGRDRFQFPDFPTTLLGDCQDHRLPELNGIILKACEYDVKNRYHTAREFNEALRQWQQTVDQA